MTQDQPSEDQQDITKAIYDREMVAENGTAKGKGKGSGSNTYSNGFEQVWE